MATSPPTEARTAALEVLETLRAQGHEAYIAGGAVRDEVMGVPPKDYDVTTSATPEVVQGLFPRCVAVGAQFGVILVVHRGVEVEVATFRTEGGYADGRRPSHVKWASAEEDVRRRDFTINGLLLDPMAACGQGEVIDYVDGLPDIDAKVVRAIGDPIARFEEDQLRLIRALRFGARLGFSIEEKTWAAIVAQAPTITSVSVERLRDELERILTEGGARRGFRLLKESGLAPFVLAEVPSLDDVDARLSDTPMSAVKAWTLVLMDLAEDAEAIRRWGRRMKTSTALARHVSSAAEIARELLGYEALSVAQRKRLVRRAEFVSAHFAAGRAVEAGQRPRAAFDLAAHDHGAWDEDALFPQPLIDGSTLRALGFKPGPAFKVALDAVEDAQLEGRVRDKDEALRLARTYLDPSAD